MADRYSDGYTGHERNRCAPLNLAGPAKRVEIHRAFAFSIPFSIHCKRTPCDIVILIAPHTSLGAPFDAIIIPQVQSVGKYFGIIFAIIIRRSHEPSGRLLIEASEMESRVTESRYWRFFDQRPGRLANGSFQDGKEPSYPQILWITQCTVNEDRVAM